MGKLFLVPRKKGKMPQPEMWGENEHGLGINRKVAREKVEALERAIYTAAERSVALGVKHEKVLDLCDAAKDVASVEGGKRR